MIKFRCTNCRGELEAPESAAGQNAACPSCKSVVRVPPLGPAEAFPAAAPPFTPLAGRRQEKGISAVYLIISVAGLLAGGAALFLVLYHGGHLPGKGMKGYEFSTPQAAVRSWFEMEAAGDEYGMMQVKHAAQDERREKVSKVLDSLKIGRTMDCDGKVVVLYQYKDEDKDDHYVAEWYEKKGGNYVEVEPPHYTGRPSAEREKVDKAIMEWRTKGGRF